MNPRVACKSGSYFSFESFIKYFPFSFHGEKTDYFNFEKFIKYIIGNRKVVEIYYYIASFDINYNPKSYANQQRFFNKLRKIENFNLVYAGCKK